MINDAEEQIRHTLHEGELYYSIVDVFAVQLSTDFKHAQNHYHVLKNRKVRDNDDLPPIKQIKMLSSDKKFYLTDCTNALGVKVIESWIAPNNQKKRKRIEKRADEVVNFHPRVIRFLTDNGWHVQHHVRLPSESV